MEKAVIFMKEQALEVLEYVTRGNTWVNEVPATIYNFFKDDYDSAIKAVSYVPNIYFKLDNKLQGNRKIIREAINGYKKYNKLSMLRSKRKPLRLKI